ncbi:hypothetical protein [Hyalangium rubrum]|uniref:HEAT repeat domain-containing protein n=1 Tax=Hyalangium rubrum TaxID=3103134 RepID=A0ABU5H1Y4_9BACT|nr:hypothetical protein [Hyalangium sp. s54d21]MDY7226919.1 hypothetical protein [Hyalangium sp. s54d21]
MAHTRDVAQDREELVKAFKQGDEARARERVSRLGEGPRQVRLVLEAMLEDSQGLVRQAGVFGLGEVGGAASIQRLEQQLAIEEARGDYDADAVVEEITRALGRIEEVGARASLVRRLERMAKGKPERSDVYTLVHALWRRRHPDLVPAVKQSLEQLSLPAPHGLHGLGVLLEKSPEELQVWARDPAVPVEYKTEVLVVLEAEVPATLTATLAAFIATARELSEQTKAPNDAAAYFCDCLFSLVLLHRERVLGAFSPESRSELRMAARSLVVAPHNSLRAAVVLKLVGRAEDAALLDVHCPEDPTCAKVFRDAAQVLRELH